MSFYDELVRWNPEELDAGFANASAEQVRRALDAQRLTPADLMALLSPAALPFLEEMARKAHDLTIRHFGRTIQLFTPLYLANHCTNQCRYCGFNARNNIDRTQLSFEEIEREGAAIAATGLRQLLLLTGDAPRISTVEYIADAARVLRRFFPSLGVEVYAMTTEEYEHLAEAGIESFTMFQETYNEELYAYLHPAGPKRNFRFRLDAPERACKGGFRSVGLGALLGLDRWRRDAFFTVMHGAWIQRHYPATDVNFSVPRMRPHTGSFQPTTTVSDKELVQIIAAYRLYMPMAGITVSSRESAFLRDNLVPLGVTRMSAGVSTAVGGHTASKSSSEVTTVTAMSPSAMSSRSSTVSDTAIVEKSEANKCDDISLSHEPRSLLKEADRESGSPLECPKQFEISDDRSVDAMIEAITARGFQPVFKDWEPLLDDSYSCGQKG